FLVVAVAYADAELAGTIDPEQLCRAAVASGAAAVLVDTWNKSSGNLLTSMSLQALTNFRTDVKQHGLLAALAGRLEPKHLALVSAVGPDIVGVRGAACIGGRHGVVSPLLVRQLRHRLSGTSSDFVRNAPSEQALGETPDAPANLSSMG
ncbi:MAG TPA: (5-formylfuran-3-yl)methyl phosphate synthase, partial [Gemmatimonadales bacterium]|nr:(5-formylfuran-3-yl)methyl phosphate synthase [Gemmatimonadales bacterium]